METRVVIQPDDAAFFLNVAVIGGALIGLSFVSLTFFLVDLLKRYKGTALPVFRDREKNPLARPSSKLKPPDSMTDRELLDGDPVVVFIAFSVAVTWNFFLLPLTIGLTAAWGAHAWECWPQKCFVSLFSWLQMFGYASLKLAS